MTQEPSFTFVIEALDNSDQAIEKSAGRALRRQLDERTVPGMDRYRLKKWCMGANIQHKLTSAPTKSNIVEAIIDANAKMTDAFVPRSTTSSSSRIRISWHWRKPETWRSPAALWARWTV